jgi:hypothetical protein
VLKAFNRRRVVTKEDPHAERPFWGPHPDAHIAAIESEFYCVGSDFLRAFYGASLGLNAPEIRLLSKAFHLDPGKIDGWGKLADLFNSKLPASKLLSGWDAVVQRLTATILPESTIEAAATRLALSTNLMWRLGQRVLNPTPWGWAEAEDHFSRQQVESMNWAKAHGMAYCRGLTDETRKALRMILVGSKEAGEGSSGLQRRLFDKISELNKDWRRIALTETAIATTNGQLASVPVGIVHVAKWVTTAMACKHCLAYSGQSFEVLAAPDFDKGMTAVWPGKNNVGRSAYKWSRKESRYRESSEMYWPCQPLHPLCCCSFVVMPAGVPHA